MGLDTLLSRLETRRADTPDTPCNLTGVSGNPAPIEACTLDTPDTPEIIIGKGIATVSRWWRLHFPDREPVEVACFPPSTHDEILERYPDAIAAEPFTQTLLQPATSIPTDLENLIYRAGTFLKYSPEECALVRDLARRDPGGLRLALESENWLAGAESELCGLIR